MEEKKRGKEKGKKKRRKKGKRKGKKWDIKLKEEKTKREKLE